MLHIIFLEPKTSGNVGAIARSMKNFGLKNLVVINPQCDIYDEDASKRAKHAKDVLEDVTIFNSLLEMKQQLKLDYLVGSTGLQGKDYNIPRLPLGPESFAKKYNEFKDLHVGLIIGREDHGLSNEEILECDFVITIPASTEYPVLNASHAASILFYELFKASSSEHQTSHVKPADAKDKEILLNEVYRTLESMTFQTEFKKETQYKLWNRIIGKSFLTKREAQALIGFLKKL
jgi:tRNA/rRNA methyltransferase